MNIGHITVTGVLSFVLVICGKNNCQAQKETENAKSDSLLIIQPGMDTTGLSKNVKEVYLDSIAQKRPKYAAFFAAALPGLGQVYNKDYWKLPILYGGGITIGYYINWANHEYHQTLQALTDNQNGVKTNPLANAIPQDILIKAVDYYRRTRDFGMILLGGLYLIQIVDAHVQAHLMNFDITEDLTLEVKPVLEDNAFLSRNFGVGVVLTFKR